MLRSDLLGKKRGKNALKLKRTCINFPQEQRGGEGRQLTNSR